MTPPVRRAPRLAVLAGCLLIATPASSEAEWQFAPFVGYTFKGATTVVDYGAAANVHWHFGGAVTLIGAGPLGVEAYIVRTPGFLEPDPIPLEVQITSSRTYALMGNAVLSTPRRWTQGLRPYLSGGLGRLHASRSDLQDAIPIHLDMLGMNLGGGAVGFVSDRVGLRFDLRYFRNIRAPGDEDLELVPTFGEPIRLRYWTASIGIVFRY